MFVKFFLIFFFVFIDILGININIDKKENLTEKNILIYITPHNNYNNLIFYKLIKSYLKKLKIEYPHLKYNFHIIIHNSDFEIWNNKLKNELKPLISFYHYGKLNMNKTIDLNNINIKEILESNILESLQNKTIKFDLIMSDNINLIVSFFKRELNIAKIIYVNPNCIYSILMKDIYYNPIYEDIIGISFDKNSKFYERFFYFIYQKISNFKINNSINSQNKIFINKGYQSVELYQPNSFYINQCIEGIHFSNSLPTNFIFAGAFLINDSKKIRTNKISNKLNEFLNKHKINIYINQEVIKGIIKIKDFIQITQSLKNCGFIILKTNNENLNKKLNDENILLIDNIKEKYILNDKRISLFIINGELNNIIESLYHKIPIIVIGNSNNQINNIHLVLYKQFGLGFKKINEFSKNKIIEYIKEIINNKKYKNNCIKASEIIKRNNGNDNFYYWLNYILNVGYEHLIIPSIKEQNTFKLYNYDILSTLTVISILFSIIFLFILNKIKKKLFNI